MTDRALDNDAEIPADDKGAPPKRRRSGKKTVLFIALPIVAVLGVAAALYFTGILGKLTGGGHDTHDAHAAPAEHKKAEPKHAVFQDLPDLLVNLNSTGRKTSFLKISVSLELESAQDVPKVQAVMPRIIDNFQVYLRELRIEDLKGSAGMYRLREELLMRVNTAAAPVKINDVLFKEMLVQ
jgi:flagellar FliL protein